VSGGSITADSLTMQADATADSKVLVFTAIVGIGFRHILVSHCHQVFRIQLTSFLAWYNEHRPHMRLGGRAPNEVYFRRHPANRRPRIEPRTHSLRRSRCARPQTLVAGQPGDRFTFKLGRFPTPYSRHNPASMGPPGADAATSRSWPLHRPTPARTWR
jgi:hypothetical protein